MFNIETNTVHNYNDLVNSGTLGGFQRNQLGGDTVTLMLFSNRHIPDMYRRPLQYMFGDAVIDDIVENIKRSDRQTSNYDDGFMRDSPYASSAILPRATGDRVTLSRLSEYWTFILIVDHANTLNVFGSRNIDQPSRAIYSGFVVDEPCTAANGGGTVLNDRAILRITHHLRLAKNLISMGPTGATSRIDVTSNWNYADPIMLQQLQADSEQQYDLTPQAIGNSVTLNTFGNQANSLVVMSTPIASSAGVLPIAGGSVDPSQRLATIVNGFKNSLTIARENQNDEFYLATPESFLHNAQLSWSMGSNLVLDDISPTEPITIGEILARYPNTNVQIVRTPYDPQYQLVDSEAPNIKRNVFASLVSTTLPWMLCEEGIANVSFRYDSYDPNSLSSIETNPGVFQLMDIAMLYTSDPQAIRYAWDRLYRRLSWSLFKIIKDNAGDFSLMVHCAVGGSTLVNLNMYDQRTESGFIETNNLMGGLNTNTVGSNMDANANAQAICNVNNILSNYAAGTNDSMAGSFENNFVGGDGKLF